MPNTTTNLGLEKPLETEYYDVEVQNRNMDKIDNKFGNINTQMADFATKTDVNKINTQLTESPQTTESTASIISLPENAKGQIIGTLKGRTLVNLLGNDGDFEAIGRWVNEANITVDSTKYRYGTKCFKFAPINAQSNIRLDLDGLDATKYYLYIADVFLESIDSNSYPRLHLYDYGSSNNGIVKEVDKTKLNQWQTVVLKFTGKTGARVRTGFMGTSTTGVMYIDGGRIYEVPQSDYNLNDTELAIKFPFVNQTKSTLPVRLTSKDPTGKVIGRSYSPSDVVLDAVKNNTGVIVARDTFDFNTGELSKNTKRLTNIASGTTINYSDMGSAGWFNAYGANGEYQVAQKGTSLTFTATLLIYQLNKEIVTKYPPQLLEAYKNGTIIREKFVRDVGYVNTEGKIIIASGLKVKSVESILKLNTSDGSELVLDPSKVVISGDKTYITHPDLSVKSYCIYVFEYEDESTEPDVSLTINTSLLDRMNSAEKSIQSLDNKSDMLEDKTEALANEVSLKLDASFYTAADVLSKVKTVDGSGSGLDADTVDGIQGTDIATITGTQTLTNKTLTAPKIANGGYIADPSGNELLKFIQTTNAVNEITVKNAAVNNPPEIQASGGDTNIDLNLVPKGTGTVRIKGTPIVTELSPLILKYIGEVVLNSNTSSSVIVDSLQNYDYVRIEIHNLKMSFNNIEPLYFQFNNDATSGNHRYGTNQIGTTTVEASSQTGTEIRMHEAIPSVSNRASFAVLEINNHNPISLIKGHSLGYSFSNNMLLVGSYLGGKISSVKFRTSGNGNNFATGCTFKIYAK